METNQAVAFVTGATGFVGTALVAALAAKGFRVRVPQGGSRRLHSRSELAVNEDLQGVDVLYHLAGLAHSGALHAGDAELLAVNRSLTLRLQRAAAKAGVGVFVWLSSIKVLGEQSQVPLPPEAPYAPQGGYAISKAVAEQALLCADRGSMRLAIVRPPLIYGPGVKGNFARLLRICASPWPLPLAGAVGLRSLLGLDNLVDFLIRLADAPEAPSIWHVRDGEEWRTTDLVRTLRGLAGRANRQFRVADGVAAALARPVGLSAAVSRLFDPLRVDMRASQEVMGWRPPHSGADQLSRTWRWAATVR